MSDNQLPLDVNEDQGNKTLEEHEVGCKSDGLIRQLEAEDVRLKELVNELSLDNTILKDVISRNKL